MFPHLTWDLEISLHNFFHQIRANGHVRLWDISLDIMPRYINLLLQKTIRFTSLSNASYDRSFTEKSFYGSAYPSCQNPASLVTSFTHASGLSSWLRVLMKLLPVLWRSIRTEVSSALDFIVQAIYSALDVLLLRTFAEDKFGWVYSLWKAYFWAGNMRFYSFFFALVIFKGAFLSSSSLVRWTIDVPSVMVFLYWSCLSLSTDDFLVCFKVTAVVFPFLIESTTCKIRTSLSR